MTNEELLAHIEHLAGPPRAKTFRAAAEFILKHNITSLLETGCYRGIPADGQSTLILAMLASKLGGLLTSVDISRVSIERATRLLCVNGVWLSAAGFRLSDSVSWLSECQRTFGFAYLDSFDHDPENPGPCQRHQLAEVGALLGKLSQPCAILLDDHVPATGGKTLLSAAFLTERGFNMTAGELQLLFTKE